MPPIKLSVVKARKITDTNFKIPTDTNFRMFDYVDEALNGDWKKLYKDTGFSLEGTNAVVPTDTPTLDGENIRAMLNAITKSLTDALNGHLYDVNPVPRPTMDWLDWKHAIGWRDAVRTNTDQITDSQLDELKKRFLFVETRTVLENFSRKFADFLIKAVDYYNIDVSAFGLKSDAYVDNRVNFEKPYHINFEGDVQRPYSEGDTQFVILHELRHVMQHLRGWLLPDHKGLFYKGERCLPAYLVNNYNSTPAEYDANRFTMASPLWTNKNLSEFWSIPINAAKASEAQYNRWNEKDG
jgi:hypothetical protein